MERGVKRGLNRRDKTKVYKHVCLDEKSVRRGHEYVTIMYDGDDGSVIEVEEGRTKESVDKLCTSALTEEQRDQTETICTDMWDNYIYGAQTYFPKALHCHDLYHCVTYLNDAVDKVRRREVKSNGLLKGTRYIWLKDTKDHTTHQSSAFERLRNMNFEVVKAWETKELFRQIIHFHYDGIMDFVREYGDWFDYATSHNIEEIDTVAFMFRRHLVGIRNAFLTGANNGKAERRNGAIQELKTVGRGYGNAKRFRIAILFFYGNLNMDR